MPRKFLPEEVIKMTAIHSSSQCLKYLWDELNYLEPELSVVKELISYHPDVVCLVNDCNEAALHIACGNVENVSPEIFELLLLASPDMPKKANKFGLLPLHKAVLTFYTEKSLVNIRMLISNYKEALSCPTKDGQLPLHLSLRNKSIFAYNLLQCLIEVYPAALQVCDKFGHCPLHKAAGKRRTDPGVITLLCENNKSVAALKDLNG
jgi:ankyrin repeat protein